MTDIQILKSKITMFDLLSKLGYQPNNDKALCFIHKDKNPSLSFNDEVWYCFGCSVGGDKIKLIEHTKNCSFIEAIAYLSDLTGYQLHQVKKKKIDHVQNIANLILDKTDWVLMYIEDEIKIWRDLNNKWIDVVAANRKSWLFDFFFYCSEIVFTKYDSLLSLKKNHLYEKSGIKNKKYEEIQECAKSKSWDLLTPKIQNEILNNYKSDLSIVKERIQNRIHNNITGGNEQLFSYKFETYDPFKKINYDFSLYPTSLYKYVSTKQLYRTIREYLLKNFD